MQTPTRNLPRYVLGALIAVALLAARADAAAIWPSETSWQALTISGGGDYTDTLGPNPSTTDLVGGDDLTTGSYTAGFWYQSEADNQLSLRMRLNSNGDTSNNVWQYMFDTDGDASAVDWVLEVSQTGPASSQGVILTQATTGGDTFGDVALDAGPFVFQGLLAEWSRWGLATDGSNFDGDADYFLDMAIPLDTFRTATGLTATDAFRLGITTSTSHTQINKDVPLGLVSTSLVSLSFGDAVPEPSSGALTALGLGLLAARARWRRARRRSLGP